jgi:glycosyltransferase involved in cell wall biosynthesis
MEVEDCSVADEQDAGPRPLISVVMPVRNGMPWVQHQLRALSAQEIVDDWELVVADNGSVDGTRRCAEEWSDRDAHVRVIDASARPGAGAARNQGVQSALGPNLAFCDADDVVQPGWLSAMLAGLAEADLVAGVFDFSSLEGAPKSDPIPASSEQMGFLPFALGANLAVRRDAFDEAHGFCETLPAGEDVDLSWRLQLAGHTFATTHEAVVAKREHVGTRATFDAAWAYGRGAAFLYGRYRAEGMRRKLLGAAKAWVWLVATSPSLVRPARRHQWVRTFGIRAGRVAGSVRHHTFFP